MPRTIRAALAMLGGAVVLCLAAALVLAFLSATAPRAKAAEMACYPAEAVKAAAEQLGQKPAFTAKVGAGMPATIYVGPDGSFTMVLEPSPAAACLFASGSAWSPVTAPATPQQFRPSPRSPRMRSAALHIRDPPHPGG